VPPEFGLSAKSPVEPATNSHRPRGSAPSDAARIKKTGMAAIATVQTGARTMLPASRLIPNAAVLSLLSPRFFPINPANVGTKVVDVLSACEVPNGCNFRSCRIDDPITYPLDQGHAGPDVGGRIMRR